MESLSHGLRQWTKSSTVPPDLIVIIRGGGAVNDLAYLNDYELAALLCKRSVPVWVGIGHEKDRTILDEVAHRSFDTPSKVIAGIRNLIVERTRDTIEYLQTIKLLSQNQISAYQSQNDHLIKTIKSHAQNQLNEAKRSTDIFKDTTRYLAHQQVKLANSQIESLMRETLLQNPRNVLAKGYSIVRSQGKAIRSIHQISNGPIEIELYDGTIQASVTQVNEND
jgi:exodeoxyribonuclease VII large subunit